MAPWVLIPALCRPESTPLWENLEADRPAPALWLGPRWEIRLLAGAGYEKPLAPRAAAGPETDVPDGDEGETAAVKERFIWRYPHEASVEMPSKLTATQLKGREKDTEVAEQAQMPQEAVTPDRPRGRAALRRPIFEKERPLTATERGTALHMAMQYLRYDRTDTEADIREEIARLVAGQFLTPAQGDAVDVRAIRALFASPLGRKLRTAPQVEREFKFSMLVPAADYYPEGEPGETLLLQGVVDCWFRQDDGTVTVVDFKTDRVTENTVEERAAGYRPQLDAYTRALGEIMEAPVARRVLWFFAVDKEVSW
jgi:ATP-dependent helicase/nuclease subunit A